MWDPTPSVRDAVGGDAYTSRQLLDAATLREIHDINKCFLTHAAALLAGTGAGRSDALGYVPVVLGLSGGARSLAAQCPYTLYDLRFQDGTFWRSVVAETCASPPVPPAVAAFGRAAVVLAWHLVRSRELAAPIVLGMAPAVLELWRGLPVSALDHLVASALPHVTARWATSPRFWPLLARAASTGNQSQLTEVRLLGMQLLAADGVRASGGPSVRAD